MTHEPNTIESDLALMGIVAREPGVYFGLNEDEYHADAALGSSSMKKLFKNPFSYWWESPMNALRPKSKDSDALIVGRAMHALVLEGEEKFEREYMCGPDNSSDDLAPSDKANRTKAAKKIAAESGQELLKFDDFARIQIAGSLIREDEEIGNAFENGYAEVSIFWRRDGIMRKCRIDYLKVLGCGDLKSITNQLDKEYEIACTDAISNYRYDMQAAHYLEGRQQIGKLIADGCVYGDHDAAWLKRVAAYENAAFAWVFVSKTGAPLVWSTYVTPPGNGILDVASRDLEVSAEKYLRCMKQFGPDKIWTLKSKPRELSMDDLPRWHAITRAF